MALPFIPARLSAQDDMVWEVEQRMRHEYEQGADTLRAMAGHEDRHATTTGNLYMLLRAHLHGSPCRVYMGGVQLYVEAADSYFCPDVFVTCSPRDAADRQVKREPVLVAEVLSPSSEGYDRGGKFASYRTLPDLEEYLLIDMDSRTVDLFRRTPEDLWVLHPLQQDDFLTLHSLDVSFPVAVLFDDLEDDAEPELPPASPSFWLGDDADSDAAD
jgi:Uma2 family endonuclease